MPWGSVMSRLCVSASVIVLSAVIAGSAPGPAIAQVQGGEEVVITGRGYAVQKDAVMSSVDVISRAEIAEKPAQGLGDMLAYLPGIRSTSFAPGASRPVIRGLEGFRVLVLNNGMGAVDASALSPDHAVSTEPLEARRIEVLRGPSALIYGGNAIGGIVNIIDDRIPTTPAANGVEGRIAAQVSSVDNGKQLGLGAKAGSGPLVFALDYAKRKSDDYDTPTGPESRYLTDLEGEAPDTRTFQENSAADMESYGAGLSWIGDFGFAGLSVKQMDTRYGVPGHSHEGEHEGEEEGEGEGGEGPVTIGLEQTRYDFRSDIKLKVAGFNRLTADAGYSDYAHTEFEGEETGTRFLSNGSEYRLTLVRDGVGKVSGTVGLTGLDRNFQAIGDEAFVPSTETRQTGVFAQYRYDSGAWGVVGGARLDRTELTSDDFARDFDTVSASLGGFYRPSHHAFAGVSLTRSERAPSDAELLADGPHMATGQFVVGNRDFATEVGQSLEFTGHMTVDEHNRFQVDAHVYASRFDNFIDLRPTGTEVEGMPVFQYIQTDADLWGFELEADTRLFNWRAQTISLNLAYDFVRGTSDLGPIARIPPQSLTARLESAGDAWRSHIEVRAVDARDDRLAELETPTEGYTMVNLFTSYRIRPGLSVFGELRNAGDVEIREATSATKDIVVGAGRSLRVGVNYSF
jgi:iron complex outermembrane receptor protein